ncbi:hypothetical protein [Flavobacterium sp.]|uniref:hypothetical protein n=1 Tax=Flavobacterium sp. TaxID=239 RepID=UPI0022C89120|nr:hypothetical protein [Flavobacterium sp.]MCZ8144882.1 hypothetical protein [Flavobacterium sp.]
MKKFALLSILCIGMITTTVKATTPPLEPETKPILCKELTPSFTFDSVVTINPVEFDAITFVKIDKAPVITATSENKAESLTDQKTCVDDVGWQRIRLCQSDLVNLHHTHKTPKILLIDPGSGLI